MIIPKVQFTICPLNETINMIDYFLTIDNDEPNYSKTIFAVYPELETKLESYKDKNKRRNCISSFLTTSFNKEIFTMEKKAKIFQEEWNKVNKEIMSTLSEIVEKKWAKKDKIIHARLSLNPIAPRYLEKRTFDIFYMEK